LGNFKEVILSNQSVMKLVDYWWNLLFLRFSKWESCKVTLILQTLLIT